MTRLSQRPQQMVETLESRLFFARALGIDVSNFQPTVNWTQVKNSGRSFVWAKATEGQTFNDASYNNHKVNAPAAGMLFGAYHFARPDNNSAQVEVDHFLAVAGNQVKAGFLRPMLDIENTVEPTDTVNTKAEMSQWVNDWCNGVLAATGVRPIVYSSVSYASTWLDSTVTQWPLWMAQYPASPNPQTGAPSGTSPWAANDWEIWQYAVAPQLGIGGTNVSNNCDLDVYNGTQAEFDAAMLVTAQEISVAQGATAISDGQATAINFGSANVGSTGPSLSFTVTNDGGLPLTLGTPALPAGYTLTEGLPASLLPGASDTFTVRLDTASAGTKAGNISFSNNDATENPFNFPITGSVVTTAPTAPSGLTITGSTFKSVSLSWTDNSNNETQFVIERKTGAGGTFAQIGTAGANITTFTDNTAQPNTNYYYHVRASLSGSLSSSTNDVIITTVSATPTGLTASDGTFNNRVALAWSAAAGALKYRVYRSTTTNPQDAIAIADPLATSYDDVPPAANTTYFYFVAGLNAANVPGALSNVDGGFFDTIAPTVPGKTSQINLAPIYLDFTFSEPVIGIDLADLTVMNASEPAGAVPIASSFTYYPASKTVRFFLSSAIPDGNFLAGVTGISDMAGNAVSGNTSQSFRFLAGDASGDGAVNALDFNALAGNFGAASTGFSGGDFNFDGIVNTTDFSLLAARFNTALPPAPAPFAASLPARLFGSTLVEDSLVEDSLKDSVTSLA